MPSTIPYSEQVHTEEMHDIITSPPAWLLRWGITIFFAMLVLLVSLSAFIRYPDTIKTQLKINSLNSAKPIVTKASGKLIRLLADQNQEVKAGQTLAFLESTADHAEVLRLLDDLKELQRQFSYGELSSVKSFTPPVSLQLGELQNSYQGFYQACLAYEASIEEGFYLKKRDFLQKDLSFIRSQREQLLAQRALQEKDYELARQEYEVHKSLFEQKVEALLEFKREESKLLAKEYPLQQAKAALTQNASAFSAKEREILELDNQIKEEKLKFIQALNSLVSEIELWKSSYVLSASQDGVLALNGIVQENQHLDANQEVFYVNPGNTSFFGEMSIPQYNMGKVEQGQKVLIKLKSYPYEEYGTIWGKIESISDVPLQDSVFVSKVSFSADDFPKRSKQIKLKNGMLAGAEIITENTSLLGRLFRSINKLLG